MRLLPLTVALCAALAAPTSASTEAPRADADDKVSVVATLPDLADLAARIGGDHVEVTALARSGQNLHAVRVKPSHLVAVSRADLFVQVGLSLEHAWVPGLLRTARNRDVLPGRPGFVSAGDDYETIEVPERLDRSVSADVHPQGNPHINLSLGGGPHMAARILEGLERIDPEHAEAYRNNHAAWTADYAKKRERWDRVARAVTEKNASACLYHPEYDYLLGEMGLEIAAFLEPRPGLVPTAAHLARVIETVREERIPVILTAPWSNNKNCARVAEATGAEVLQLPIMVEERHAEAGWLGMIDGCVDAIARAYGVDPDEAARREPREDADGDAPAGDGGS